MKQIFIFDTLHSMKLTIKEAQLYPTSFDFTTQIPYTHFKNLWHISLHNDSVKNSFSNKCHNRNTIVTGPNAAGKSTFIKSVLINIMLSQTITFCASEECIITPFEYIGSQINIPDILVMSLYLKPRCIDVNIISIMSGIIRIKKSFYLWMKYSIARMS